MTNRFFVAVLVAMLALAGVGCRKNNTRNVLADVDSKQPDKVLFDRSMDLLKRNKFDTARITLQTLINTYPDSEYVARAKLGIADAWYAEGGSAALAQAEVEYKDFITFFPMMTEASEAQLKVAGIHYKQMLKPDRDYTHARRAEDEYKNLVEQFPDSPLVPEAKQRLMEVQEVLAEREFRIGRYYFLRQSYPASIARLKSVADNYELYSGADETLYLLGQAYEGQATLVRNNPNFNEAVRGRLLKEYDDRAAEAYSKIISRYPVTDRVKDATARLQALKRPVPTATPEMIAQNKKEEESRSETGTMGKFMMNFRSRPDVARAAKVGEPNMAPPKQTDAVQVAQQTLKALEGSGENSVSVEKVGTGQGPGPSQEIPRSDSGDNATTTEEKKQEAPPAQSNESTSKKKKKKGLGKLNPF